ncbi:iron-hydroxamate ABC transporter substrate-binding protein [Sporolactobacillus sp. THM7-7]|nr:iron-hydroxamate ABC transporter substrate-binding protein [Sporolactobacillus sp. THM7-7]
MKRQKLFLTAISFICCMLLLAACGNNQSATKKDDEPKTKMYHADNGHIKVPTHPLRVVDASSTYTGCLLKLGITPVGVTQYAKDSAFFGHQLDKAKVITSDSVDKIMALKPDLIITYTNDKNIKKLSKIAPTVAYTYEKRDYLEQFIEIGQLVGKEKQAKKWVDQWNAKTKVESEKVKKVIGPDATATVLETYGKEMYIFGDNWGRGSEVIYQALGIKMPERVKKETRPGYKAISTEVIPKYAGDYMFVSSWGGTSNNSFMKTDVWKSLPAYKNHRVITLNAKNFYFNDPISLEKELTFIVQALEKANK